MNDISQLKQELYVCPMHSEVQQSNPGKCPKCGMNLVLASESASHAHRTDSGGIKQYYPLFLIIGIILLASFATEIRNWQSSSWHAVMSHFMAGFFLVFSGFKFLDLKGFAEGYSTYDLLAKRIPAYGFIYPFIELYLGLSYLGGFFPYATNWIAFMVMGFSSIGVAKSLLKKQKFQCACLGTIIKVPLSNITLVEDLVMAVMALFFILN